MVRVQSICAVAAALALAGCVSAPGRLGPVVEADAPAPFLSVAGRYPTQRQAQAAIDLAVGRYGVDAVYSSFSAIAVDRRPSAIALFACKPGFYRPSANVVVARRGFVHCHVDVMDERDRLLGRSTTSFYLAGGGWRLASVLEREVDAR